MNSKKIKKKIETKHIDNNANPVWNHEGFLDIKLNESDLRALTLKAEVYDENTLGNTFLGKSSEIPLEEYFTNAGKWFNEITIL